MSAPLIKTLFTPGIHSECTERGRRGNRQVKVPVTLGEVGAAPEVDVKLTGKY